MKKRFLFWTGAGYIIYAALVFLYLFVWTDPGVPAAFQGSAADPSTFMTQREQLLSQEYSRYQNLLYLLSLPIDWIIYAVILVFGLSYSLKKASLGKLPLYVLFLSAITWLLTLPISYISRRLSLDYGVSIEPFSKWMRDNLVSFWIDTLMMVLVVFVLYWLIRRFPKRWWLYAWLMLVPFMAFLMYIQPVVIDPLYNDFNRLTNPELEESILQLADQAGVPAERVFEVNKSQETNALNAYVNGIGDNLRIVLWDTTLNKLSEEEVLFIMAHEIGHYVKNHLMKSLLGVLGGSLLGLYAVYRLLPVVLRKWGEAWKIEGPSDFASLPAVLLLLSLFTFIAQPVEMAVSRQAEEAADAYAIDLQPDTEAAIGAFQQLTVSGLSDVNPPTLIKYLRYGHPTMLERLSMLIDEKGS
ncbi:M48 family metallopeptidase [Salimicrobium halophilum]|uniref:Zn-dependent protease with chaperone function n=1 Tax=Salimicrobium halophilum TaxID=86666 RepID=A0A1G8UT53_9BACI|nr:M48 family metallopeptidase [Salimicrobium halophilum]SDJ57032.1 Zn-dependent protease with chaperone function [Salimicrobium halophilum]